MIQELYAAAPLFRALRASAWDLAIVGWHLGDVDGRDLLRWMRATFPVLPPVVFFTAHNTADDIVFALENGALDYIVGPIPVMVLRARLKAIARRIAA
ncbi:response regulator transcription factor [Trinickia terrae]|uniref:response regulator transcription factor n=1 Tax=Trinickia terrae TaxID=2571161 RepID=UPI00146A5311|nr:response regulator [Trinickia terrae]